MFTFIIKGGPVMIPIILGSILGLAVVLERFWAFRLMKLDTFEFVQQVFKLLKAGRTKEAMDLCTAHAAHPLPAVFKIGIERRSLPVDRLEKILEQAGNNQIQKLEKHLGILISITSIEPMLGFLGTITGLIRAFMTWERAGANVTVNSLAGGIYEAMITTAAGLIIAIPLYMCYHYFVSRIKYTANELNNHCLQLLELFTEDRKGGGA